MIIWKESVRVSDYLFDLCKRIRARKDFSLADQLYRATLSISNNIAEGSGSASAKDFANFLNISRRSIFECANLLYIALKYNYLPKDEFIKLRKELLLLSKMIYYFRQSLLSK